MAIGICIFLLAPFAIMLGPHIIVTTLYSHSDTWIIQAPKESYLLFIGGFLLLCTACMVLFLMNIDKKFIIVSLISLILSLLFFYMTSQFYMSVSAQSFSFRQPFSLSENSYTWQEVKSVVHYMGDEGESSEFKIHFNDGKYLVLHENGYTDTILGQLYSTCREYNIKVKHINKS